MIPKDFNEAHAEVAKLVQTFEQNHDKYLASDYNETQARKDFIDKFFIALGWEFGVCVLFVIIHTYKYAQI